MKPPNHGLLHLVTIVQDVGEDAYLGAEFEGFLVEDVGEDAYLRDEFEGFLVLAHPGEMFTGLALVIPGSRPPLLIDRTDRVEVLL